LTHTTITVGASRVASRLLCLHAVAITPAGAMKLIRSCFFIVGGLPRVKAGSAPATILSRPAQRSLTLRPARSRSRQSDPFHQRLQRLRCLCRCFDCYRVERTSSRAGLSPAEVQRLFTAHFHDNYAVSVRQRPAPPSLLPEGRSSLMFLGRETQRCSRYDRRIIQSLQFGDARSDIRSAPPNVVSDLVMLSTPDTFAVSVTCP
jgi:AraC-like DNA-binding protein